MSKNVKVISTFLGVSIFLFGVLKFIDPFKGWYKTQVVTSELPFQSLSYWSGQLGEIAVGLILLFLTRKPSFFKAGTSSKLFLVSNFSIIIMMIVAFYVHLHPNVPSDVLPLKISAPVIPGVFLLLAGFNVYLSKSPRN